MLKIEAETNMLSHIYIESTDEYVGTILGPDSEGVSHLIVLAEYYSSNGKLREDIDSELKEIREKAKHCFEYIKSGKDVKCLQIHNNIR